MVHSLMSCIRCVMVCFPQQPRRQKIFFCQYTARRISRLICYGTRNSVSSGWFVKLGSAVDISSQRRLFARSVARALVGSHDRSACDSARCLRWSYSRLLVDWPWARLTEEVSYKFIYIGCKKNGLSELCITGVLTPIIKKYWRVYKTLYNAPLRWWTSETETSQVADLVAL